MRLRYIYEKKFGQEDSPPETYSEESFHFKEHPDNIRGTDDVLAAVAFPKFGRGEKPRTYEVEISWLDVESLLHDFIRMEHPNALYLRNILRMTRTVEDHGWHHDSEPPEFWDRLFDD